MLGRWALILTVVAVCISTAGCQRRGEKRKKGKEWRDFGRDWGILMDHIFSEDTEEADILSQIKCCKSSDTAQDQSHAVCRCMKRAHFKQSEYKQLKMAVGTRKRHKTHGEDEEAEMLQMLRRGNVAMLPLLRRVTTLMGCLVKITQDGTSKRPSAALTDSLDGSTLRTMHAAFGIVN